MVGENLKCYFPEIARVAYKLSAMVGVQICGKNAEIQKTNFNFVLPDMSSVQYERHHGNIYSFTQNTTHKEEQYHTTTVLVKYGTCNCFIITINRTIMTQKSCHTLHHHMKGEPHIDFVHT